VLLIGVVVVVVVVVSERSERVVDWCCATECSE